MFTNTIQDVDYHILSFLNAQDLGRSCQVNKKWQIHASSDRLWKNFFPTIPIPKGMSLKKHFDVKAIISINGLIKRIEDFARKVPHNRNGEFHCYFPHTTKCFIVVKITNNEKNSSTKIKDFFWFMETVPLNKPVKDVITLTKDCKYLVHLRLPGNLYFKDTASQIIEILALNSNNQIIKPYTILKA